MVVSFLSNIIRVAEFCSNNVRFTMTKLPKIHTVLISPKSYAAYCKKEKKLRQSLCFKSTALYPHRAFTAVVR